jgi:tRNA (guanine-N7-)-methyltransferase
VGKNKLARWAEMELFDNVIQPDTEEVKQIDHPVKGKWNSGLFKNNNPIILELGCGKGEYSVGMALKFPDRNFVGIDIKGARIWRGAKTAFVNKISNVMFLRTRIEFINSYFAEDEVDEIWLTFPDPHPKRRSIGKRLSSPHFLNQYRQFLKEGGAVHLKTDNNDLYTYTLEVVKHNGLEILSATDDLYSGVIRNDILSIRTHYENIFLAEGKKINYLSFRLKKNRKVENPGIQKQV